MDDLRLETKLTGVRDVAKDLAPTERISGHLTPIGICLDDFDNGGVEHVAALAVDPDANGLPGNRAGHKDDPTFGAPQDRPPNDRSLDPQHEQAVVTQRQCGAA